MYYTVILSPLISTSTWKCGMITDKNILFLLWSRPRWCLPGDLFRWRDHKWKTSVPHTKVGCWRGCRQKTLGGYLITNHYQNVNCTFSASFFFIWKQRITTAACVQIDQWYIVFLFSEQVPRVLPIRQDIQLWHIWLRRVESDRLRFHAVERTLSSSWSHDQGVSAVWKQTPQRMAFPFQISSMFEQTKQTKHNQAYQANQECISYKK